jgi:PRTase ComF-like
LYHLDGPDAAVAMSSSPPFSATQYSRYKYGSVAAAEAFARALGEAFCECRPQLVRVPRLLMTSSPYTYVPTAATALARSLQPVLNAARARAGLPPARFVQVDRLGTSAGDYGTLSAAARDRRMAANVLSYAPSHEVVRAELARRYRWPRRGRLRAGPPACLPA